MSKNEKDSPEKCPEAQSLAEDKDQGENVVKTGTGSDDIVEVDLESITSPRDVWDKDIEFLLASIGYCVGVGNIWRFPYLCYKNGGGAFLIPYFTIILTGAVPMYLLEIGMGQYTRSGCIRVWDICPVFRGIGIGINVMAIHCNVYFILLMVWAMHFLFTTINAVIFEDGTLPWMRCDAWWNTPNCRNNLVNVTGSSADVSNFSNSVESTEEYWERRVLRVSDGIEHPEAFQWELVGCLALAWTLVYFCIWKGVKSSGKVVYFTALFPYVILIALAIRGLTLPGSIDGLRFFITPDIDKLKSQQVWLDAGTQVFYSAGIAFGCLMAMGSYNKYNRNYIRDGIMICCVNSLTSLLGGVVIFTVLGYMAFEAGVEVKDVASSGPGLAFIVYPKAIALMPLASFWACTFFFMLVLVGIDSQFVGVEGTVVAITDLIASRWFVKVKRLRELITLAMILISFVVGLTMVTHGGLYVFQLYDWYAATGLVLFWFCFWECVAFSWGYGADYVYDHIEDMIGFKLNCYLKICWKYVTPGVIKILFLRSAISYQPLKYTNGDDYPVWAHLIGLTLALSSSLLVPGYALYKFIKTPGSFKEALRNVRKSVLADFPLRRSLPGS